MTRPHENLDAWREAMLLVRTVYGITKSFPNEEIFGLTSQIRRSAISVPSNIAEGAGRIGKKDFARFLDIAQGSLSELETQLLIAVDLGYLEAGHSVFGLSNVVGKLISGLHRSVSRQQ